MAIQKDVNMLDGPLFKSVIAYTVPIIFTNILQLLFNAADLIVVGRFCGSTSVAAVGATNSLVHLIVNLFIGISAGTGIVTAQAIGSGNNVAVHRTVHTAIPTAIISGLFLTLVGVLGSEYLLGIMGTPEKVLPLSAIYMKIYFAGITATMIYNFSAAILRAAGDTRSPLIFLLIAGVVNVVLNVIFVVAFDMDVAGVALATAISQVLSAVLVVIALMRRTDACRLNLTKLKIYGKQLRSLIVIGVPSGIQGCTFSLSNVIIQSSINSLGEVVVAGGAAAASIEQFVYTSMNAFHQTAVNFSGQNTGFGNYKRIKKIFKTCCMCVATVGFVLGVTVFIFARPLLSIYITDSPAAIEQGVIRLSFICLPYLLCGLMEIPTACVRGMGYSVPPMIISIAGVCAVRLLWIFTVFQIPAFHTAASLYISYPISWAATFTAHTLLFTHILKKRIKEQGL